MQLPSIATDSIITMVMIFTSINLAATDETGVTILAEDPGSGVTEQNSICDSFIKGAKGRQKEGSEEFEFSTPNYPKQYPNSTQCFRLIIAPVNHKIVVDFREVFEFEPSLNCDKDFLEIRDGPYGFSPLIDRYCKLPSKGFKRITSTGSYLWLRFHSDATLSLRGFKAVYHYVKLDIRRPQPTGMTAYRLVRLKAGAEWHVTNTDIEQTIKATVPKQSPGQQIQLDVVYDISVPSNNLAFLDISKLIWPKSICKTYGFIEIFDNFTVYKDSPPYVKIKKLCSHTGLAERLSTAQRIIFRLFTTSANIYPLIHMSVTAISLIKGGCPIEWSVCDQYCYRNDLRCNGRKNCPNGLDEKCDLNGTVVNKELIDGGENPTTTKKDTKPVAAIDPSVQMHASILCGIAFLLAIFVGVCLTITIQQKRKDRRRRQCEQQTPQELLTDKQHQKLETTSVDQFLPNATTSAGGRNQRSAASTNPMLAAGVSSSNTSGDLDQMTALICQQRRNLEISTVSQDVAPLQYIRPLQQQQPNGFVSRSAAPVAQPGYPFRSANVLAAPRANPVKAKMSRIGKYLSVPNPSGQRSSPVGNQPGQSSTLSSFAPNNSHYNTTTAHAHSTRHPEHLPTCRLGSRTQSWGAGLLNADWISGDTDSMEWYCGPIVIRGQVQYGGAEKRPVNVFHVPGCRSLPDINGRGLDTDTEEDTRESLDVSPSDDQAQMAFASPQSVRSMQPRIWTFADSDTTGTGLIYEYHA